MFRFSIRELLLSTGLICVVMGWVVERNRLNKEITFLRSYNKVLTDRLEMTGFKKQLEKLHNERARFEQIGPD